MRSRGTNPLLVAPARSASKADAGTGAEGEAEADDVVDFASTRLGRPSKTQRKTASHALQALGVALLDLPDARLDTLGLPEALVDALRESRRLTTHEAKRRQEQRVGKLMRGADVEAARVAVAELRLGRAHDALSLHEAERWRAELEADDDATTRFATAHAGVDLQRLRALVRQARKDAAANSEARSGRAHRELFRFVREQMAAHPAVDGR